MHRKFFGSLALSALLASGFGGCGSSSSNTTGVDETTATGVSPYERVAVLSGGWADVPAIADKLAQFTTLTDEDAALGFSSGGWVIAGANTAKGETYSTADLLPIPGMGVASSTGTSRVVEFCNGQYATMAMNTGRKHGPALPCEVSVHSDGTNIYIDMLNADAIFSVFFTDISDPDGTLATMASQVKSELRTMILAALDDTTTVAANFDGSDARTETAPLLTAAVAYTESTQALGPQFTQSDIDNEIALRNPYIVYRYQDGGNTFTGTDAAHIAQDIIDTLRDGADLGGGDYNTADDTPGLEGLSAGSLWRSGRPEPLPIPGIQVVEACSPKYAKKATKLGNQYITALPCEVAVYVDESDPTVLTISFLNPSFMFGTMFQGAVESAYTAGTITRDEVVEYSTLAEIVFGDLRMIVDHAVQNNTLGRTLTIVP